MTTPSWPRLLLMPGIAIGAFIGACAYYAKDTPDTHVQVKEIVKHKPQKDLSL